MSSKDATGSSLRSTLDRRAVLTALATAGCTAALAPVAAHAAVPSGPGFRRQMRGVWIASVVNIDWPSRTGLEPAAQRAEFVRLADDALALGFNALFVQIRPTADAFWPSPFEPWSQWLTGTQGRDPKYDPLAFMVETAHQRGLAFHAWFNPYRVSMQADPSALDPRHPARTHPEWTRSYGGKLYYDPGVPAARRFCQEAMLDAVRRYEIDGVHFDDYFYPYPAADSDFPDEETFREHGTGYPDKAAWRRANVDLMVREMRDAVRAVRPNALFGISPFGVWRNATTDPRGSRTAAFQSYDGLHADTRGWVKQGWLDYIAPQVYWHIGLPAADYGVLAPWWAEVVRDTDTELWIGQAVYKSGAAGQPAPWQDGKELSRHLALNTTLPEIGGDLFFSAKDVRTDPVGDFAAMRLAHWQEPVLGPLPARLDRRPRPVRPVVKVERESSTGAAVLRVSAGGQDNGHSPFRYAIHRFSAYPGHHPEAGRGTLIAVVPGGRRTTYHDAGAPAGCWYAVAAVDRVQRHGRLSRPAR
ncbi:glycoside hydrolase family 10 protein [Streptomyces sp. NBC_00233]|uniref:glycoside hydrolase family 10 protein n=1 Tax=Streptomyces sp. NBC_00233 TaxID=2975686 RepID=UPI00225827F8|nr:family 10 glycosylhydrolase [Streptomyces sp. NBC_00233]MCX5232889.1 family 10 glycosylhydrolase [Streptomyces sp. NBC_00233]